MRDIQKGFDTAVKHLHKDIAATRQGGGDWKAISRAFDRLYAKVRFLSDDGATRDRHNDKIDALYATWQRAKEESAEEKQRALDRELAHLRTEERNAFYPGTYEGELKVMRGK